MESPPNPDDTALVGAASVKIAAAADGAMSAVCPEENFEQSSLRRNTHNRVSSSFGFL